VNRQTEMANPKKCRDSRHPCMATGNGRNGGHGTMWPAAVLNFEHSANSTLQQTESMSEMS
jgi:hypothetical protein